MRRGATRQDMVMDGGIVRRTNRMFLMETVARKIFTKWYSTALVWRWKNTYTEECVHTYILCSFNIYYYGSYGRCVYGNLIYDFILFIYVPVI